MPQLEDSILSKLAQSNVETIDELHRLESLRGEWRALWRRCPDATPFQSDAWLIPWWHHLGSGELRIVTMRSAHGHLVDLALWHVHADPAHGNERTLSLIGTGVSDYCDVLVEPAGEAAFAVALARAVDAMRDVRRIDFQKLRRRSLLLQLPRSRTRDAEVSEQMPCPVLTLTGERNAWLPERMRDEIELGRRQLASHATVRFERADPQNVDELFPGFLRVHAARWADRGGGVLAAERVRRFHNEVIANSLASDVFRLYVLRVDGTIVAGYYGFLAGRRAYYYLGGFDPRWRSFGVGHQIIDHAMTEAVAEGATTFDFLRGREPYKYRWGARDEPTFRLQARLCHA